MKINKRPELVGQGVFGSALPMSVSSLPKGCPSCSCSHPRRQRQGNEVEEIPANFLPLEAG